MEISPSSHVINLVMGSCFVVIVGSGATAGFPAAEILSDPMTGVLAMPSVRRLRYRDVRAAPRARRAGRDRRDRRRDPPAVQRWGEFNLNAQLAGGVRR